ncbi:hypothetical protein BT69DRAFT_1391905 [Atractiella rhizophila]|nr:hypothetical protein BT69DRAFT_1391905 [Atractiella rhizophila]
MSQFFIDFATPCSGMWEIRRSLYQRTGINPDEMAEVRYDRMLIKGEHQMGVYESRELQELKARFRAMVQHLEPCWSAVVRKLEEHFPEQTESMRDLWDNVPGTVEGLGLSGIFTGVVLNYGVSTWLHVDKRIISSGRVGRWGSSAARAAFEIRAAGWAPGDVCLDEDAPL